MSKAHFKNEIHVSIYERDGQSDLVWTWHTWTLGLTLSHRGEIRLAPGILPGALVLQVLLTILYGHPQFSLPTDGAGDQESCLLLRLHAQQFDLLCCLFCPSLKGKDVPTLLQHCTSLCPDNHETVWETENLSPCPLPPLEKNSQTELGLFGSRGGARLGENSPFLGRFDV